MNTLQPMPDYPFTAVAGHERFKLALILAAINPTIGGVLISGPRGCGKSTLARALAEVMPGSPAFVTLPLGATEEMVAGTLNLQQVLHQRQLEFQPGVLARAHGGVLYVDEVNLLPDALVDLLLDVAASGYNRVERDGISHEHAAEFLLLGTMNPDEGELRPQLLDRFGLMVELDNQYSIQDRVEVVQRHNAFELDPQAFCSRFQPSQQALLSNITMARRLLPRIECPGPLQRQIAERCHQAGVEGVRADIVWHRAAVAHAAWHQQSIVREADLEAVEALVLAHRRQHQDQQPPPPPFQRPQSCPPQARPPQNQGKDQQPSSASGQWGEMQPEVQKTQLLSALDLPVSGNKTAITITPPSAAVSISGRQRIPGRMPNWFATLVSSAGQWPPAQVHFRSRRGGQPILNLVLLDTSASTLKQQWQAQAKGVVSQLAQHAYLAREQLAILGFGSDRIQTILKRGRAPRQPHRLLDQLPAGGGTPMRQALLRAGQYLKRLLHQHPGLQSRIYLITDGRSRQRVDDIRLPAQCTVIDIEQTAVKRGRGHELAKALGARYLSLSGAST